MVGGGFLLGGNPRAATSFGGDRPARCRSAWKLLSVTVEGRDSCSRMYVRSTEYSLRSRVAKGAIEWSIRLPAGQQEVDRMEEEGEGNMYG